MSIYEEMAADAAKVFAEFGKPIRIGTQTVGGLVSEPQETLEMEAGGWMASGNFTVKVLRGTLERLPRVGEQIEMDREVFRVVRVSSRPQHPLVVLTVEPIE